MKLDKKDLLLYAITDSAWLNGRALKDVVKESLDGGATCIQYRQKHLDIEHFILEAKQLQQLCRAYHVPFIIDDNVDIASIIDADGVHVGQNDMCVEDVRKKLGPDKIIGASAHTVQEAILAEKMGADYLGVGSCFTTTTKEDAKSIDFQIVKDITHAVSIPVIGIGGITNENVRQLGGFGLDGVAVISAIYAQKDILQATKELKSSVEKMVQL